jgi:NADH:ubiquinone oxidoreductase subunit H
MMIVAIEIAWLFFVLPSMEMVHHRLFQSLHPNAGKKNRFLDWYFEFFYVLIRRPAQDTEPYLSFARKGLLYVALVFPLVALLTFASGALSVLMVLGLMFCLGIIYLLMGFTFEKNFIALYALEKSLLRQSVVLVLFGAIFAAPFITWNSSLHDIAVAQMSPLLGSLPALGVFRNPIAFLCACVALSIHLKQWEEDEFPLPALLRKPMQSELFGIDLLSFKIARTLEHLAFYSLIAFVFLGGPYLGDLNIEPWFALGIVTAKIFFVAFVVIGIHFWTPRMQQNQLLRLIFLVLLPLELASYPLSLLLNELLMHY